MRELYWMAILAVGLVMMCGIVAEHNSSINERIKLEADMWRKHEIARQEFQNKYDYDHDTECPPGDKVIEIGYGHGATCQHTFVDSGNISGQEPARFDGRFKVEMNKNIY